MHVITKAALAALALGGAAGVALAQSNMPTQNMPMQNMPMQNMPMQNMPMQNMPGMGHGAMHGAAAGPATAEFEEANARMHKDMAIAFSGNADVDFARGMIPHHQGAIDMARIELKYGKDPELRKLAEDIIKAQESEIAFLKAWIAKNAK